MKRSLQICLLAGLFLLAGSVCALAAKTYTVLPFTVNGPSGYKYLGDSIPGMFSSRLYWKGNFEPVDLGPGKQKAVADANAAEKARQAVNADYVIWGSLTIAGENCSIDMNIKDASGQTWPRSTQATVNNLIPSLQGLADTVNADVFKRPRAGAARTGAAPQARPNQMNPELMHNQPGGAEPYLNPQFRYAGNRGDESRLRSQALPYSSVGMEVCDADGDGRNEIFILADHRLYAYRFEDYRLQPIGELQMSMTQQNLIIRSIDLDLNGRPKLVITAYDGEEEPISRIFSFNGREFKEEAIARQWFLNVVSLPPFYRPTLIGQLSQPPRVFRRGVYEMHVNGNKVTQGGKLNLPDGFNLFNFSYIPPANTGPDPSGKIIMLSDDEHLRIYSDKGARLAQSEDLYSGHHIGVEVNQAMLGMGKDDTIQGSKYYIPMRMPVVSLGADGNYEVIVNKPITTSGRIFADFRSFPESEIHAVYWDGVGLNMLWKTRRIKGSTVDYAIQDANNDGITDLVVCINTYPGALGFDARKTMVLLYPLDLSRMDPNAPSYDEDADPERP